MTATFLSVRTKLLALVMLAIFCALAVAGVGLFIYDIGAYRAGRINDMTIQIELLTFSAGPALQFRNEEVALENLRLLQVRPQVKAAALYDEQGRLFASYLREGQPAAFPPSLHGDSISIAGNSIVITRQVVSDGLLLGTAYMEADYLASERALSFAGILLITALVAIVVATALALWLQTLITRPVLSIAQIARDAVAHKDYARRAHKLSNDEVGTLVDAFNDMMHEIELRTSALETSNRELENQVFERKRVQEEVVRLNEALEQKVEQLHESDRQKDNFLATLAHELRNPLAPIRTSLELLRSADADRREQLFDILTRQTHQLIRLVDDLMDVSRISRGKVSMQKQLVTFDDVLQVAVESTQDLFRQKQHQLELKVPSTPLLLLADPIRLSQVFLNLLSNAAHYTNKGGRIELVATRVGAMLEVRIRDNGIGMSEQMLEKIFEPFVQIEGALTKSRSGLGIGLTLARTLLQLHGGSVHAESAGPGQGSCLVVQLPLAESDAAPAGTPPTRPDSTQRPRRVMIVDDNEDAALTLAMALRLVGHEVKVVFAGAAALREGGDFLPEFILMDLGMPGMSGLDAAKAIRQCEWGKQAVIIAVTGWGQQEDRARTREAGFDHHMVKPVEVAAVNALFAEVRQ